MTTTPATTQDEPIHDYFRSRSDSDDQTNTEAEWACACGFEYAWRIAQMFNRPYTPDGLPDLSDLSILELGPGLNFGSIFVCQAAGAHSVAVADKYLVEWNESYHPRFYYQFLKHGSRQFPGADWSFLDAQPKTNTVHQNRITEYRADIATDSSAIPDNTFDAVVSNAVLEHVEDMAALASTLYRITASSGVGIHQVDFRDHSNPDHPLEFLKIPEDQYRSIFREALGGGGNRIRPLEMSQMFVRAGFTVEDFTPGQTTDLSYVREVQPNLQPRFAAMSVEKLAVVGGRFFLRRN